MRLAVERVALGLHSLCWRKEEQKRNGSLIFSLTIKMMVSLHIRASSTRNIMHRIMKKKRNIIFLLSSFGPEVVNMVGDRDDMNILLLLIAGQVESRRRTEEWRE